MYVALLQRLNLFLAAAGAMRGGDQLAPLHIKPGGCIDHPFVMAATAQGIAFVLVFNRRFSEGNYVCHTTIALLALKVLCRLTSTVTIGKHYDNY